MTSFRFESPEKLKRIQEVSENVHVGLPADSHLSVGACHRLVLESENEKAQQDECESLAEQRHRFEKNVDRLTSNTRFSQCVSRVPSLPWSSSSANRMKLRVRRGWPTFGRIPVGFHFIAILLQQIARNRLLIVGLIWLIVDRLPAPSRVEQLKCFRTSSYEWRREQKKAIRIWTEALSVKAPKLASHRFAVQSCLPDGHNL